MEQEYILKNQESFELQDIFECGQCFRWNKQQDGSYIGIIKDAVINVKKENGIIFFKGVSKRNLKEVVIDYFDLKTDYQIYKNILNQVDEYLKESIKFGSGIRILKQDLWECIISFIISANNNIPRIKKIIERISKEYGDEIVWNNEKYYLFPTPEQLAKASIEDLRNLGLGFRDKRVFHTTQMILNREINLEKIYELKETDKIREELLKLDGVGEKVADCIMLFALKREDVFPIDVWVRRVMNDLYIHYDDEEKVNKKELQNLAAQKFLGLSGIAQQYLFYWKREEGKRVK